MDLNQLARSAQIKFDRMIPPGTRAALTHGRGAQGPIVSSASGLPSAPAAFAGLYGKVFKRTALPFAIYEQAKEVFDPKDNIITRTQALINRIQGSPQVSNASQASLLDRVVRPGGYVAYTDPSDGLNPPGPAPAPSPILTPADSFKPAPFTQEGQFGRYFKTPEFDYVFGGGARGKGAPATAAAMEQLAAQEKAPMDSPLSSYYAAQSAMGRVNQPQIQEMYKDRPDLQKWAAANPMLAQREYARKYGTTDITNLAPDEETVMGDLGSRAQAEGGYTLEGFGIRDKVDKFLGKK